VVALPAHGGYDQGIQYVGLGRAPRVVGGQDVLDGREVTGQARQRPVEPVQQRPVARAVGVGPQVRLPCQHVLDELDRSVAVDTIAPTPASPIERLRCGRVPLLLVEEEVRQPGRNGFLQAHEPAQHAQRQAVAPQPLRPRGVTRRVRRRRGGIRQSHALGGAVVGVERGDREHRGQAAVLIRLTHGRRVGCGGSGGPGPRPHQEDHGADQLQPIAVPFPRGPLRLPAPPYLGQRQVVAGVVLGAEAGLGGGELPVGITEQHLLAAAPRLGGHGRGPL